MNSNAKYDLQVSDPQRDEDGFQKRMMERLMTSLHGESLGVVYGEMEARAPSPVLAATQLLMLLKTEHKGNCSRKTGSISSLSDAKMDVRS